MKKWIVGRPDPKAVDVLSVQGGLSPLCAGVLASRGIDTIEKAAGFFNQQENAEILSDPFLIKDMQEAADIIQSAVDEGKKICVYGDYDCDGITAAALLYSYLECIGGDVTYYINHRSEGYGMSPDAVRKLAKDGVQLIVTVDNGISAVKEAALAAELGIELVITDHHQPGEMLPEAAAVVDPHRADDLSPFKHLCGCGVALKLAAAMDGGDHSMAMEQFSDLAAIATVADIVPLVGENREIVRQGLHYLENTENPGLKALMEAAGVRPPVSSTTAAFSLAPRINASGRFGSAVDALRLLLCDDPDTAAKLAENLNDLNSRRKKAEAEISEEIHEMITNDPSILYERVIFLYGEGWHHGVIGIVASRLCDKFGKPVFILSDDGEYARGSARAPEGFSVYKALSACADVLTKFGGHSGAGGFSLLKDDINALNAALQRYSAEEYTSMPVKAIKADKVILPAELNIENVSSLKLLEPCGEGNPSPLFAVPSARLQKVSALSEGKHTKLEFIYGNISVTGLLFGQKTDEFPYKPGETLDMLISPEINTYNGRTSVNVRITDIRRSGISQSRYFAAKDTYESFKRGETVRNELIQRIVPDRQELAAVYRAIPKGRASDMDGVYYSVCSESMNYCKFRISLDIFAELGLVRTDIYNETAEAIPVEHKADLDSSAILRKLKETAGMAAV